MVARKTWEEMRRAYPNEWILISEIERDEDGMLRSGVVERHSTSKEEVYRKPSIDKPTAFRYTGESTFSGLRSYVQTHNPV